MSVGRHGSTKGRAELLATATLAQQAEVYRRAEASRQTQLCRRIAEKIAGRLSQSVADGKLGRTKVMEELFIIGRQTARSYGVAKELLNDCVAQAGQRLVQNGVVTL